MQEFQELVHKRLVHALKGLEVIGTQELQGFGVGCGLESSFEHQETEVKASKEALGPVCGTLRGAKASWTNCLQVVPLLQLCLEDDTSSFPWQPS